MSDNRPALTDSPSPDEARLVRRAKSGDSEAFGLLYDACVERVYRYVYFRITDEVTAEDITAQVFLKGWERLDNYQPGNSPFIAWLYTIARNLVIDHYRTRKTSLPLEAAISLAAEAPGLDEQAQVRSDLQAMRVALQRLTEDQQQVLILKFIAGLTTETIARMMGKREGSVRALQMRALQTLAKHLKAKE